MRCRKKIVNFIFAVHFTYNFEFLNASLSRPLCSQNTILQCSLNQFFTPFPRSHGMRVHTNGLLSAHSWKMEISLVQYYDVPPLTVTGHAQPQTFLEAAVLAPVSVDAVHYAVLVARTLVVDNGRLRPPEEPFAPLARDNAVVNAAGLVAAHLARYDLDLSCNKKEKSCLAKAYSNRYHCIINI